jgi:hypothetical protein
MHRHPGMAKCWARVNVSAGTPTLAANYNITSITDTATGRLTITIATDFTDANWACIFSVGMSDTTPDDDSDEVNHGIESIAAGSVVLHCWDDAAAGAPTDVDPSHWHMVGFGDQS